MSMIKKEKIQMLYTKYGKLNLKIDEMCNEIGISSSKVYKIFSDIGEKEILIKKLIPKWRKIGSTRMWSIDEILKWNDETEIEIKQ